MSFPFMPPVPWLTPTDIAKNVDTVKSVPGPKSQPPRSR